MLIRVDGVLQRGFQLGYRTIGFASDSTERPPIMRFFGVDPDGFEEHRRGDVMGVSDEGNAHPGANRLVFGAEAMEMMAGANAESDGGSEGGKEREHDHNQRSLSGIHHHFILAFGTGFVRLLQTR